MGIIPRVFVHEKFNDNIIEYDIVWQLQKFMIQCIKR